MDTVKKSHEKLVNDQARFDTLRSMFWGSLGCGHKPKPRSSNSTEDILQTAAGSKAAEQVAQLLLVHR